MILKKRKKLKFNFRKTIKNVPMYCHLHVKCNFKNTLIYLTKQNGGILKQWSTKSLKKTKFQKNSPYNIQLITNKLNVYLRTKKIKKIMLFLTGNGIGKIFVLNTLIRINIPYFFNNTPRPFNGCRKKKMKRL